MEQKTIIEVIKANKGVIIKRALIVTATALGMFLVYGLMRNEGDWYVTDDEAESNDGESAPEETTAE